MAFNGTPIQALGCAIFFVGLGSEVRNTTVMAAGLSLLLLGLFYWWFNPSWPLLGLYTLVALVASLSVPLLYRISGFTLADELDWLERREAREYADLVARLRELRTDLTSLGITEGARQAETLAAILDDYHSVVETRFLGKKHSPLAYLSAARRVQKHAMQNLTDVVAIGHSLASISRHDLGEATDSGTVNAAEDRVSRLTNLQQEQQGRLQALLDENQQLFDALTATAVEVANIRSFSDFERLDTLARLVSLAEIANRTGKQ